MNKIIMLGTGSGVTMDLYNTCFVIQNDNGNFLVDTGGGVEILKRLKQVNIDYKDIRNIFISHNHTDHILGLIWLFKRIGYDIICGANIDKINVYCNSDVHEAIQNISKCVLPNKMLNTLNSIINYIILNDGDIININGTDYKFFDALSKRVKLFGFECIINDKKLAFLGDETLDSSLYDRFNGYDYIMHEVFCLDSDGEFYHISEIPHSTVKSVCEVMERLNVKNLILYHTEEMHGKERKELYTNEGKEYYNGNIIVPDDLEVINL